MYRSASNIWTAQPGLWVRHLIGLHVHATDGSNYRWSGHRSPLLRPKGSITNSDGLTSFSNDFSAEEISKGLDQVNDKIPVILIANKSDGCDFGETSNDCYQMDLGDPVFISATNYEGKFLFQDTGMRRSKPQGALPLATL